MPDVPIGTVGFITPVRDYIETLVHPSAQQDALTAARHRAFIAPRLLGSVVALASFPVYLFARGAPGAVELMVFAWLVAPILTAYFLSRTGRYESAHVLSSLALTGLVTIVAVSTGGIASFAAIWLVVVPLEAALSASRRVVAIASTFALAAAGLLVLVGAFDLLPATSSERTRGARGVRDRVGGALRRRARARRRSAGAHELLAPLCRGGPLPAAGAQHDRRDHAARPRRRRAVRFAGGAIAVRLRRCRIARARSVRPRPCCRPPGLSDRARRCRGAGREPLGRVPCTTRLLRAPAGRRCISSGSRCAAGRWSRLRSRSAAAAAKSLPCFAM